MNDMQFKAVVSTRGPVLVLAGAGSGKTTVLVNRLAYLLKYGNAYLNEIEPNLTDSEINQIVDYLDGITDTAPEIYALKQNAPMPWNILAITFTNKAANELKERLCQKITDGGEQINAGTFHSICGKILRVDGERLGYDSSYTIYDTNDTTRVIKDCQKALGIEDKILSYKTIRNEISRAKDSLISPQEYLEQHQFDFRNKQIGEVYKMYQESLLKSNAMDFDDMIANTVKLFENNPDVLEKYQQRFRYIVVDEYQDTNHAQYMLIKLLASEHKNICVVGDDDQSIYKFRGATIENILQFEDQYENAVTIRLEQNYRSTNNILGAANSVIKNNQGRKGKNLWSDKGDGDKIICHTSVNENEEAKYIAETILDSVANGKKFSDHAVLYRMNALSSTIENVFARSGVPYTVYGGLKFYDRAEVKDVLSYLQFVANPNDDLRLTRIINTPRRGIGDTTVNKAKAIAAQLGTSVWDVFCNAQNYEVLKSAVQKLKSFCDTMNPIISSAHSALPSNTLKEILEKSGYTKALQDAGEEEKDRLDNVNELLTAILHYEEENDNPTLNEYLQEVALITDIDALDGSVDRVALMTLHSAKGLEFPLVFIAGMEENIFPSVRNMYISDEEIEEERRLAYVGITRAKEKLYITNAFRRMLFGNTSANNISRFVSEIKNDFVEFEKPKTAQYQYSFGSNDYSGRRSSTSSYGFSQKQNQTPFGKSSFSFGSAKPQTTSAPAVKYTVGEKVSHKVFGAGVILSATQMGNDTMLEIAFDKVGTKKVMAKFAKIEKI